MALSPDINRALDKDISQAHRRFTRAMEGRLPSLALESKERYFAVLSLLTVKLEESDKTLRQILSEVMVEAAGHLMAELNSA